MNAIKSRSLIPNNLPTTVQSNTLSCKKFQTRSVQTYPSTLTCKLRQHGRCRCPLMQKPLDYNKLQEMAKEIQEEPSESYVDDESLYNECLENDETFTNDEREENTILVWTIDPSHQKRCTCTSSNGLTFQQVLSKFQMTSEIRNAKVDNRRFLGLLQSEHKHLDLSTFSKKPTERELRLNLLASRKSTRMPLCSTVSKQRTRNWVKSNITNPITVIEEEPPAPPNDTFREQKLGLQTLLKGLQDEFFALNCKYRELDKQINKGSVDESKEALKELDNIQAELSKKEEEIDTVMSLYKEMVALKGQIKQLKEQKREIKKMGNLPKTENQLLLKKMQSLRSVH